MNGARRAVVAVLLAWWAAHAGPALAGTSQALPKPSRTVLDNGVTVLVQENPAAPVVAASVFVKAGGAWETEEDSGITNLLQQVMVKGTDTRSAVEIAEAAEALGGSISASADIDFSEIRGTALARRWRELLDLIADVSLRPSLPDSEIDVERGVALRAIRNRQDQPFPLAMDTLLARLYGGHPYGRPTLGRAPAVERLDRAALLSHYRRYYVAPRIIVSVSGEVPSAEVVAEAARLFASAPRGAGAVGALEGTVAPALDRTAVVRPSAQAQVLVGFLAPRVSDPDYAAVKVLSSAVGGGMAGRLFTELRDKQGLAYSTSASYPTRVGPSFLVAQLGTAPANARRAEDGLKQQIARMRDEAISDGDLARAKTYLLGQFALDRRTNARLAWYAAFFESAGVGSDFADRYVRAVERVTAADVQRVARTYLGMPTIVSVGPSAR